MQYNSIKNICQVLGKILIILFFCIFLTPYTFAQTSKPDTTSLKDQAAQAMSDLVDGIIEIAKVGALAELKTGEFKYLYDPSDPRSSDPMNIAQREKIEEAVNTLIEANRDVIYINIIKACGAAFTDIKACSPKSRAEVGGSVASAVINRFDDARRAGSVQLDQLILITEVHTIQQIAIDKLDANIQKLQATGASLVTERRLVDGYVSAAQQADRDLNFVKRFFVGNKMAAGISDLVAVRNRIGSAIENINQTTNDLMRMKHNLENRNIKPADIDKLMKDAEKGLTAVKNDTNDILAVLNRPTLAWLIGKYNELHPDTPVNLVLMRQSVRDRLIPLDEIIKSLSGKEMRDNMQKLKDALGVPNVFPNKPLIDQLKINVPHPSKPSSSSGNPTGTIIGTDGLPFVDNPPIGNKPKPETTSGFVDPLAIPPQTDIPSEQTSATYRIDWPYHDSKGKILYWTIFEYPSSLPSKDATPYNGKKIQSQKYKPVHNSIYIPPEKRADSKNGTIH